MDEVNYNIMNKGEIAWKGKSGTNYTFIIFPKETEFNEIDGNYIFAKETFTGWNAVYIGEGDLKTRTQDNTHLECAKKKGFTHYHIHENEEDLSIMNYERVYNVQRHS